MMHLIIFIFVVASVPCEARSPPSKHSKQVSGANGKRSASADPAKPKKARNAYLQTKRALMVESAQFGESKQVADGFTESPQQAYAGKAEAYIQQSKALRMESARVIDSAAKANGHHSTAMIGERGEGFGGSDERSCKAAFGGSCTSKKASQSFADVRGRSRSGGVLMQKMADFSALEAISQQIADPFAGLDDAFDDSGLELTSELLEESQIHVDSQPVFEQKIAEPARSEEALKDGLPNSQNISIPQIASTILEICIGLIVAKCILMILFPPVVVEPQEPQETLRCKTVKIVSTRDRKLARVALLRTVKNGDTDRVAALLNAGAEATCADTWGFTALHMAAASGVVPVAEVLLDYGAEVDVRDSWEEAPLHVAARSGFSDMCKLLLQRRASINSVDLDGQTALVKAARSGHAETCELLLDNGACAQDLSDAELPPLLSALLTKRMLTSNALLCTCEAPGSDADAASEEELLKDSLSENDL